MILRRFAALWLVAVLCVVSGCIFSPNKKPPTIIPLPDYPKLINPYSVLDALRLAYAAKDTNEIKLLYDKDNYVGTSFDADDQSRLTFNWSDEVAHVAALARHTTITSVVISYPPSLVRYSDLADPPDWATIELLRGSGYNVEISDQPTSWFLKADVRSAFKFIPKTPDPTSSTDTTWKIVRWSENH